MMLQTSQVLPVSTLKQITPPTMLSFDKTSWFKKKIKMKFKVQMGTLSSKYDTTVYSPYWKKSLIPGASGTVISFVLAQRLWLCNFLQGLHIYLGGGGSEGTTCQSCTKQINNGRYSRIGTLSSIYLGTKLHFTSQTQLLQFFTQT